ncbi:hypothetical protein [Methylomonas sp. MgM2]
MTTTINPLAEIRQQGFDADLHQHRVRIWPRHKMNKALALFVTAHLPEITQALVVEYNEKRINNVLLWEQPTSAANENGPPVEAIPDHLNGARFAGVPAAASVGQDLRR